MKARKRNNKWQYDFTYVDLKGKSIRVRQGTYATKKEALEYGIKHLNELSSSYDHNIKFGELTKEYLDHKRNKISKQSLTKLENNFRLHFLPLFENVKANDLTIQHVQLFQEELLNKGISTSYINKLTSTFSSVLKFGQVHYDLKKNVANLNGGLKNTNIKKIDFFTYEEWLKFESVIDDIVDLTFFTVLYYCGLRKGECFALTWNDINFDKATINIDKSLDQKVKGREMVVSAPKTKSSIRVVKASNLTIERLKALKQHYMCYDGFSDKWLCFGAISPIKETTLANNKNKYCELAGLKQIRIHDFRHSHASLLINKGVNVLVVSKRLGHSDIKMTLNTYSHLFDEKETEAVDLLNDL